MPILGSRGGYATTSMSDILAGSLTFPALLMRTKVGAQIVVLAQLVFVTAALAAGPLPVVSPARAGFDIGRLERMHSYARGLVAAGKYPGLVTLIARDGKIVEWQSFGERAPGVPLKPDDIFAIASLTKIVTTVGALVLVEEGRLGIDDPIATHLPEFKDPKVAQSSPTQFSPPVDAVRPITLRHLLTHTAGLSGSTPLKDAAVPLPRRVDGDFTSLADMSRELAAHQLQHQPGEKWVYGPATDVLGRLVEVVSGKPFDVFLEERVLRPLKMRDTSFAVPPSKQSRQVTMYVRQADGSLAATAPKPRQHPWPAGSGGLYSTPADYVRFAQMLLNGGELDGVRILGRKTVELMTQDHLHGLAKPTKIYPVTDGFGFGVEIRTDVARSGWLGSQGTYGWNGATTAYCSIDPKERLIAMVWAQHTPNAEFQLYERFNNLVYQALVR